MSKMMRPIGKIIRPTNCAYRSSSQVATKTKYEEYWMPFTNNRSFKSAEKPKIFHKAKG
jgi:hypothetical protein